LSVLGGAFGSGPSRVSGGGGATRRGRDWPCTEMTIANSAHAVIVIRRSFWFLMWCDSFRFPVLFSNDTGRETICGTSDAAAREQVCPLPPERERKAASANRERWPQDKCFRRKLSARGLNSEVQFQSELKLPWVKGSSRPAVIMAVAGALLEGVDVVNKTGHGAFVEAVE
jgi:hypothetical protein